MAAPAPAPAGGPLKWLSLQTALAQCNPGPKPLPRTEVDLSHPLLPPGAPPTVAMCSTRQPMVLRFAPQRPHGHRPAAWHPRARTLAPLLRARAA
jgi:hypothetical protein